MDYILITILIISCVVHFYFHAKTRDLAFIVMAMGFFVGFLVQLNYMQLTSQFAEMQEDMCIVVEQPTLRNLTAEEENEIINRTK